MHEGVEELRELQNKSTPVVNGRPKVSVTSLMAGMAVDLTRRMGKKALIVLDAYFAVGPVFSIIKQAVDENGDRMLHVITMAKSNVVGYETPLPSDGRPGRPRTYGAKRKLMDLFQTESFDRMTLEIYGQSKILSVLCLDLIWKPIKEKVRFVLVCDGDHRFILMCSDVNLPAADIIRAYSYRFKIEVSFKVLKHLIGAFYYRFWTSVWPRIGKQTKSDLSAIDNTRSKRLIREAADALEAFVNFGCIANGILQILALNYHQTIWQKYQGWLRTITSTIPSEEVVQSVIQMEYYHNFRFFRNSAIYRIIMSKSKKSNNDDIPLAA